MHKMYLTKYISKKAKNNNNKKKPTTTKKKSHLALNCSTLNTCSATGCCPCRNFRAVHVVLAVTYPRTAYSTIKTKRCCAECADAIWEERNAQRWDRGECRRVRRSRVHSESYLPVWHPVGIWDMERHPPCWFIY